MSKIVHSRSKSKRRRPNTNGDSAPATNKKPRNKARGTYIVLKEPCRIRQTGGKFRGSFGFVIGAYANGQFRVITGVDGLGRQTYSFLRAKNFERVDP
jgi:hypothetical protein